MYFHSFNVGYIDIPNTTTLNIYTVGCPHNCIGCHAADLQDFNHKERQLLTADLILEKLNKDLKKAENPIELEEKIHGIGMLLLLFLMLIITINDIINLF